MARWIPENFFREEFWQLMNEHGELIEAAYIEDKRKAQEKENNDLQVQFWIGNILSAFGTFVINMFATKKLSETLGSLYAPKEWKNKTDTETAQKMMALHELPDDMKEAIGSLGQ